MDSKAVAGFVSLFPVQSQRVHLSSTLPFSRLLNWSVEGGRQDLAR